MMLHLLPGGKLKKVTDVLELLVILMDGSRISRKSLQISVQMLVGM